MLPTDAEPTSPGPGEGAATNHDPRVQIARRWPVLIVAGSVAGVVAWLGGEATLNVIEPSWRMASSKGIMLKMTDRWGETTAAAWNAGLAFAILGGSVGACLGLAAGLARRNAGRGIIAAVLGFVVGAAGALAMAAACLTPFNAYRFQHPDEVSRDMLLPLLIHVAIWSVAGAAGGLAVGVGGGFRNSRVIAKAMLGGVVGATLGTVVYELAGAVVFSGEDTMQLVAATWPARLAARLAVALGAASGVALALHDRRTPPDSRPA